jgi:hypothetical protein
MSVSGISSSFNYNAQSVANNGQQSRQEFQQLGQDLQSGNLSAAKEDFATLQQLRQQTNSTSSGHSNSPIAQEVKQLSQDLASGNLSAAQQDYAKIQQDIQTQMVHRHHHHHGGGNEASAIGQSVEPLSQALQSGNLSAAQQAYSTLQQDLPPFVQNNGPSSTQGSSQSSSNSIQVIA